MKKSLQIIAFLFFTATYAQVSFGDSNRFNLSIIADPKASIDEGGINIGAEIEMVEQWGYIHSGVQSFDALKGGYLDWTTGLGVNLKYGYFDQWRYYAGGRLGLIKRSSETYPTAGLEAGFEVNFDCGIVLGMRATYDYREDFKFTGAEPGMQYSNYFKIGFKL